MIAKRMSSLTPFFKAFGPLLFGRPAGSTLKKLARMDSLQELYELFGHLIPEQLLAPSESGINSRERTFTSQVTFWAFAAQVLSPGSSAGRLSGGWRLGGSTRNEAASGALELAAGALRTLWSSHPGAVAGGERRRSQQPGARLYQPGDFLGVCRAGLKSGQLLPGDCPAGGGLVAARGHEAATLEQFDQCLLPGAGPA